MRREDVLKTPVNQIDLESIQTITAYIVQVSLGDTPAGGVEYKTIFAAASLLFVITLGMNVLSHKILAKYREVYE